MDRLIEQTLHGFQFSPRVRIAAIGVDPRLIKGFDEIAENFVRILIRRGLLPNQQRELELLLKRFRVVFVFEKVLDSAELFEIEFEFGRRFAAGTRRRGRLLLVCVSIRPLRRLW